MVNPKMLLVSAGLMIAVTFSAPTSNQHRRSIHPNEDYTLHRDVPAGGVEAHNSTTLGPREEARAMCSVRTSEGNATANVTISRRLHGVLTPREFHTAVQRLELIVFGQMQQLWQTLDALKSHVASTNSDHVRYPGRSTVVYKYVPSAG